MINREANVMEFVIFKAKMSIEVIKNSLFSKFNANWNDYRYINKKIKRIKNTDDEKEKIYLAEGLVKVLNSKTLGFNLSKQTLIEPLPRFKLLF